MGLFSNWLGVWPKDLPRLYPQADDRSLTRISNRCRLRRDSEPPDRGHAPPRLGRRATPLDRAFGVGLARLLIRDLMLVANLSVHDQDDTPHLYLESAVEGHKPGPGNDLGDRPGGGPGGIVLRGFHRAAARKTG